jgi:hypothetical protein
MVGSATQLDSIHRAQIPGQSHVLDAGEMEGSSPEYEYRSKGKLPSAFIMPARQIGLRKLSADGRLLASHQKGVAATATSPFKYFPPTRQIGISTAISGRKRPRENREGDHDEPMPKHVKL